MADRLLIVANEIVDADLLADRMVEVFVVAPALNSRLRRWVSDEDPARRAAQARLAYSLKWLRHAGVDATGQIGDADPVQAIDDALGIFDADEVVIVAQPGRNAHVLERARSRFRQPVALVEIDPAALVAA